MKEPRHWRCIVCGYIAEGDEPPAVCPVCGATREYFEPYDPPKKRNDRQA